MTNEISKILTGIAQTSAYQKRIAMTKPLVEKWSKTGLMDGIKDENEAHAYAVLLENQAKQLVKESSKTGQAANSEEWNGVALPLVRRIFNDISAKEFLSMQPMTMPSGLVFWIEFKYGTAQAGFTTGAGKNSEADALHGVTNTSSDPSGGLYGAGRFGYSINNLTSSLLTFNVGNTLSSTTAVSGSKASDSDINFDTAFSASLSATGRLKTITVSTASLTRPDVKGVRAFKISGSGIYAYYPQFTRVNSNGSQITFVVSSSATGGSLVNARVTYHAQPTDTTRGDFEEGGSHQRSGQTDLNIPEVNIELRSEAIVAKTRKLKAKWTDEFSTDLDAYQSVDAETEVTGVLSEYISAEIDLELLDMLIGAAPTVGHWSAKVGYDWNGTSFTNNSNLGSYAFTKKDWYETFGTSIAYMSNKIHQKTMRGGANVIVCSPDVATVLESIPGFASSGAEDAWGTKTFAMGVKVIGTFKNQYKVFKNPYMLENTVLVAYKGNAFLETGAVYAPYVPLMVTPVVLDPDNFTPRKGVSTRYAKKVTRPEFFGKIYVHGLETIK